MASIPALLAFVCWNDKTIAVRGKPEPDAERQRGVAECPLHLVADAIALAEVFLVLKFRNRLSDPVTMT